LNVAYKLITEDEEELRGKQAPLVLPLVIKETEKQARHVVCTGGQRQ